MSVPLVSLGLSTDTRFVAKLLQSLLGDGNKSEKNDPNDIKITLKDFVKIFNVDKIGERMSKIVKKFYMDKKI